MVTRDKGALRHVIRPLLLHALADGAPVTVFAGHTVTSTTLIDLARLLVAVRPDGSPDDPVPSILATVTLRDLSYFWRYRLIEVLAAYGPADSNLALTSLPPVRRRELLDTLAPEPDRSSVEGRLPRNYWHVVARAAWARAQFLGVQVNAVDLEPCRAHLARNRLGYLDDSTSGAGRYDNYSLEALLFSRPLRDLLEPSYGWCWTQAADLVWATVDRSGATLPWGRSGGVFARAVTLEFCTEQWLATKDEAWLSLARMAFDRVLAEFDDGLLVQFRTSGGDRYRGDDRWLQSSLDVALKLWRCGVALEKEDAPESSPVLAPHQRLVRFDERAGVLVSRRGGRTMTVPFVEGHTGEYLPAPVSAGLVEAPADVMRPVNVPVVVVDGRSYVSAGPPAALDETPSGVVATWERLRGIESPDDELLGTRTATFQVTPYGVDVTESWQLPPGPGTTLALHHLQLRGTRTALTSDAEPAQTTTLDAADLAKWRTRSGPGARLTSFAMPVPTGSTSFRWSLRAAPRVAVAGLRHWYVRGLYDALGDALQPSRLSIDDVLSGRADVVHMHWPEHVLNADPTRHAALLAAARRSSAPVVWTVHNLEPHGGASPLYDLWSDAADVAIHHSKWGMELAKRRYAFPRARHVVVPHPHFSHLVERWSTKVDAEAALGWPHVPLRLFAGGADRPYRSSALVVEAASRLRRTDVEVVVRGEAERSLDPRVRQVPDDMVARSRWDLWLQACDAILLPVHGDGLSSGLIADAVAFGLPVLTPEWGYTSEQLPHGTIRLAADPAEMAADLDALTAERLGDAAEHVRRRRDGLAVARVAGLFADVIISAVAGSAVG